MQAIAILLFLGVFDGIATLYGLYVGSYSAELNPLLSWALDQHVAIFVALKMSLTITACYFLWAHRDTALARVGVRFAIVVYSLVALMHLYGLVLR